MCKHRGGAERIKSSVQAHVTLYRSNNSMVETVAYRRMSVRVRLERLSFVGEMIYLTVELNFHKTIIYYSVAKSRLVGLKRTKSCTK